MDEELVIGQFKNQLRRFIISKVGDEDTANDILQDTLMKIYVGLPKLKNKEKLTSWVYQITRNTITDHFRNHKSNTQPTELPPDLSADESLNHELTKCIVPFIKQLPEKYQHALKQTDLGQLSQKEYAAKIGTSYSGAKSNVQRARAKLKELFHRCCQIESDKYGHVISYKDKQDPICGCS